MQEFYDLTEGETLVERVGFPSSSNGNNQTPSYICLSDDEEGIDNGMGGNNANENGNRRGSTNESLMRDSIRVHPSIQSLAEELNSDEEEDELLSEDEDEDYDDSEPHESPTIQDILRGHYMGMPFPPNPFTVIFEALWNGPLRPTPRDFQPVIDVIPSLKVDEELKKVIGDNSCAICICDIELEETVRKLPCAHYFHQNCIDQWLKGHLNCPLCKADVGSSTDQVMQNIEKKKKEEEEKAKEAAMTPEERESYRNQKVEEEKKKKEKKNEQQRHREQQHARRAQKRRQFRPEPFGPSQNLTHGRSFPFPFHFSNHSPDFPFSFLHPFSLPRPINIEPDPHPFPFSTPPNLSLQSFDLTTPPNPSSSNVLPPLALVLSEDEEEEGQRRSKRARSNTSR